MVGYYGPIHDELSTRAEEALYGALAAGETARYAVREAREAAYGSVRRPRSNRVPRSKDTGRPRRPRTAIPVRHLRIRLVDRGPRLLLPWTASSLRSPSIWSVSRPWMTVSAASYGTAGVPR